MQKVAFRSGDLTLRGTLVLPDSSGPHPGVAIFHGMISSEDGYVPLATALAEHGIAGLAVSMRGHGGSEGDFKAATVAQAVSDGSAAYDFLTAQPSIDADRIGLVGSSVGAILAALTTAERQVRSLVFRAPAAYTAEMMQLSMAQTMVAEDEQFHEIGNLAATPAGEAIAAFAGSLLVVASEYDAIIPATITQGYIDAAQHASRKRLLVIKGATHTLTDPKWKEIFSQATVDWFKKSL